MANTFLRKFSSNIGNTTTSVGSYTVGSNIGAVIIGLTVSNTTNRELSANIALYNGVSSYYLAQRAPIPSGGSLVVAGGEQKIVLQPSDSIQVQTESGYGLDAIMTIMETSSIGLTIDPVTYSISANVSSVNEGAAVGFTVTTNSVPDGTIVYWTTSGNVSSSDFSDSTTSGNVTISSGSANIVRSLTADATTEGTEHFALQLRLGSISGSIVATSSNVIVNDTSILVTETINLSNLSLPSGTSINSTTTKFISKSISFSGSQPDSAVVLNNTSWKTFPLTIEYWFNVNSGPADAVRSPLMYTVSGNTTAQVSGFQTSDTSQVFRFSNQATGSDSGTNSDGTSRLRDTWYHATFTLYSSTGNVTVADRYEWGFNGTRQAGGSLSSSPTNYQMLASEFITLGTYGGFSFGKFAGNIGQIRVSNIRRYPSGSTYTLPTVAWTADGNTISLIQAN